MTVSRIAIAAALAVAASLLTGCASSQALRTSLEERNREIADLEADNAALAGELGRVRNDRDRLQATLEETAAHLQARPEPASVNPESRRFGDLDAAGIGYGLRGDHVVFSVPSAVTFASGKANLTPKGIEALMVLARRMKSEFASDTVFHVEGHTDTDPIKKSKFTTNRDLSWARARAVHDCLVTKGKISDERFVVVGHGPHRPVAAGKSVKDKAKNRRVEVIVHAPGER